MQYICAVFLVILLLNINTAYAQDFDTSLLFKKENANQKKVNKTGKLRLDYGQNAYYIGDVVEGFASGLGKFVSEKYVYTGSFFQGDFHGDGTISYSNGDIVEGLFTNSIFTKGTISLKSGGSFSGEFNAPTPVQNIYHLFQFSTNRKKKFFSLNGKGSLVNDNLGLSFIGYFKNGKPLGKGTLRLGSGNKVTGNWNGFELTNSYGIIEYNNGAIYSGEIKYFTPNGQGELRNEPILLKGFFVNGKLKNGTEKFVSNGEQFEVTVKNSSRHGIATNLFDGNPKYYLDGELFATKGEYESSLEIQKLQQMKAALDEEKRQLRAKQRKAEENKRRMVELARESEKRQRREAQEAAFFRTALAVATVGLVTRDSDMDSGTKQQLLSAAATDAYFNTGGANLRNLENQVQHVTTQRLKFEKEYHQKMARINSQMKQAERERVKAKAERANQIAKRSNSVSSGAASTVQPQAIAATKPKKPSASNIKIVLGTQSYSIGTNSDSGNLNNGIQVNSAVNKSTPKQPCSSYADIDGEFCAIEKVALCKTNSNGYWFCAGSTQFTNAGEKGDGALNIQLAYAGCDSPYNRTSLDSGFSLFYCNEPLKNGSDYKIGFIESMMKTTIPERFKHKRKIYRCERLGDRDCEVVR